MQAVLWRGRVGLAAAAVSVVAVCAPLLALAATSVSLGTPCHVRTDLYEFDVPACWVDDVTVDFDGDATVVRLTDAPEVFLMKVLVLDADAPSDAGGGDYRRLGVWETGDGRRVELWCLSYAGMALGGVWRDATVSNPTYPGRELEQLAVGLSTGGMYSACEMWAMSGAEWAAKDDAHDGYAFYRAEVLPTLRVTG